MSAPELESLGYLHTWRPYQERVLAAARLHLADRRLHVVAAPGSGKTTLGLEVFRMLGKPALALSPTRTIREQWIERLRDFVPRDTPWPIRWVSRSLETPGVFTSITYQALHAQSRAELAEEDEDAESAPGAIGAAEIEAVAATLRAAQVGTLILDEAHHLRQEWWKALTELVTRVEDLHVIALTATPPYDAEASGWQRYEELCGTIDEEISTPELVKAGTLCPHQDFVWTVVPTERESEFVAEHARNVARTIAELLGDPKFEAAVTGHDWFGADADLDEILDDPGHAMALLAFRKAKRLPLPERVMKALDLRAADVPELTLPWWQRLLSRQLAGRDDPVRKKLVRTLRDRNLLTHRDRLQLEQSQLVASRMTRSVAKIDACAAIHRLEREVRGESLRQVILTDFVRAEELLDGKGESLSLGAWPIFRRIATEASDAEKPSCALLTGRVVVVHESLSDLVGPACEGLTPLSELPGFARAVGHGAELVAALTDALARGRVRCLVGTRALLGEGWDAPAVNSLVLASNVGAYMFTNQMRGRAIRVDRADSAKVASIWHLLAVVLDRRPLESLQPFADPFWPGLADLRELEGRFETFVGVDAERDLIESGLARLHLPFLASHQGALRSPDALFAGNDAMAERLRDLGRIRESWARAIGRGTQGRLVPGVGTAHPLRIVPFRWDTTLKALLVASLAMFVALARALHSAFDSLTLVAGLAFAATFPWLGRSLYLGVKHFPIDGSLHQIGIALRDSLCVAGFISTPHEQLEVRSEVAGGSVRVSLLGATYHEQSVFADCLREIASPVENPRYLLVRRGSWLGIGREDYYAVPARLGSRKENAERFAKQWRRRVSPAKLVYTRAPESHALLLRARVRSFSAGAAKAAERLDGWL